MMKRFPSCFLQAFVVLLSGLVSTRLLSQALPVPKPTFSLVTVTITSVSPSQLVVGQSAVVTYSVSVGGISPKPTQGSIGGSFQDYALQQVNGGSPPLITLHPGTPVTGTLIISSLKMGAGTLAVNFYPPTPVGCPAGPAGTVRCRIVQPIATATLSLNVVQPTVVVRIAGSNYADIKKPDSGDSASSNNGYLCIVHNPGCGWWGNSGTDKFFNQKALPAVAKVVGAPEFINYWPLGLDSSNQGAWTWFDSSGTYYAHADASDPSHLSVKWNNTCAGPFSGKNLYYSVSFLISIPKGTDLGETAYDPNAQLSSPCLPSGYSATPVGAPPVTITPIELYLTRTSNYFTSTFGSGSSGTIQQISNGENFTLVLVKPSNYPGNCSGSGNVVLTANQNLSGSGLNALYGGTKVSYPLTIEACVTDTTTASTRQSVGVVISYLPSNP